MRGKAGADLIRATVYRKNGEMRSTTFFILEALIRLGGSGDAFTLTEIIGDADHSLIYRYTPQLKELGWIWGYGTIRITERGKIVHAIECGRRTKRRAKKWKDAA